MSINNLLLSEKYRPKKIDDIVILDRVKNLFNDGVTKNYIFYGNYGIGKTTLARILIGKYSKDKAYLEINSSLYTSIEILRNEVETFCKTIPMLETSDPIKYVFLDEFDRVSTSYQDAMKAFIEQYHKNVRFILTTNHINKITDGIKSRFTCINFDCESVDEEKSLKRDMYKRIVDTILPIEEISIKKEDLAFLINKKFPDFRSILNNIQNYKENGLFNINSKDIEPSNKIELYDIIYSDIKYEDIYSFVVDKFGPEKIDVMITMLSTNFVNWVLNNKKEDINKLFELNYIISDYSSLLDTDTDPIILAMTIIGKFREVIRK